VPDWTAAEAAAQYLGFGVTVAEGKPESVPKAAFTAARERMLADPVARKALPAFVVRSVTPELLWGYLRAQATGSGSWAIRRGVMHDAIDPVMDALHGSEQGPADELVGAAVARLDAESVREAWTRALERRDNDPEAAVTAARALLEATCKTILDDRAEVYNEGDDLPVLYKRVQKVLQLSPAEQTEERFRAILGACTTIVKELGSVRNRHSDAHASGRTRYRLAARHASLAVNLAGSMGLFLIETHEARTGESEDI
jgi:Abortive infection C-terminus